MQNFPIDEEIVPSKWHDIDPLPDKVMELLCDPRIAPFPKRDAKFSVLESDGTWKTTGSTTGTYLSMLFDPGDGYRALLVSSKNSVQSWETSNPSLSGILMVSTDPIEKKFGGTGELVAAQVQKKKADIWIQTDGQSRLKQARTEISVAAPTPLNERRDIDPLPDNFKLKVLLDPRILPINKRDGKFSTFDSAGKWKTVDSTMTGTYQTMLFDPGITTAHASSKEPSEYLVQRYCEKIFSCFNRNFKVIQPDVRDPLKMHYIAPEGDEYRQVVLPEAIAQSVERLPSDGYFVALYPSANSISPWQNPHPSQAGIILGSPVPIIKKLGGSTDELIDAQVNKRKTSIKLEVKSNGCLSYVEIPRSSASVPLSMRHDVAPLPDKVAELLRDSRIAPFPKCDGKFSVLESDGTWKNLSSKTLYVRTMLFNPGDGYRALFVSANNSPQPWEGPNPSLVGIILGSTKPIEKKLSGSTDELVAAQVGKKNATLKLEIKKAYLYSVDVKFPAPGNIPVVGEHLTLEAPTTGRHSPNAHLFPKSASPDFHGNVGVGRQSR